MISETVFIKIYYNNKLMFTISAVQHNTLIIRSHFDFRVSKIHTHITRLPVTNNQ